MEKKRRPSPISSPKSPSVERGRSGPSLRVLVVDDFEPFRRFVCSTLEHRPDLQVIGEASDGLEAVQKARELQPDLIVLDIGLPKLNGIEAARQILELSSQSKILVLTQETSDAVVQEVLSLGALGFVVKMNAGSELLIAVEAVCQGRQFLSRGLPDHNCTSAPEAQVPDQLHRKQALLSLAPRKEEIDRSHVVQFYSDDASFLSGFARFIEAGLNAGKVVIVVLTESHRNHLFQRLQAQGVNIGTAIERRSLIPLDVAETLARFMVNDLPDPVRFLQVVSDLLAAAGAAAKGQHPRVAACGECAPILWAQGKADAAVQLERLWDDVAKTHGVEILCGYVLNSFQREEEILVYERICREHSAVCPSERAIEQI